jgi:MFS family permease
VFIITMGLVVWSVLTAACGLVHTFLALALTRVGVGVGEASCSPPAHSLIADYFPPERRATALATYALGSNIGALFGFVLGGWIAEFFGWRNAFFVVGLPGIALALFVWMTVGEPRRGLSEGGRGLKTSEDAAPVAPFGDVVRQLVGLASFRHLAAMGGLNAIAIFSLLSWSAAFLQRVHGMSPGESGSWLGPIVGLGMAVGTILSGTLCDRLGARDVRWQLWLAAIGGITAVPFLFLFLVLPNPHQALFALIPAMIASSLHVASLYTLTQGLAPIRMRAQAAAVMLFILNFVGSGLGSFSVGIVSDLLSGRFGRDSLRYALFIVLVANLWGVFHALLAARSVREDLQKVSN